MNEIQTLIDRQLGIHIRPSYDNVLKRLVVSKNDSFRGVQFSQLASDYNPEPPIFACRFAETTGYEHVLALANEDGRVAIQDTTAMVENNDIPFEGFQCHNNAVFDLSWMPGQMKFVTVSGDHTASLWDVAESSPQKLQSFSSHTRSVKTAVFRPTDPSTFATGARDGHVLIWDIRVNTNIPVIAKPDNCILNCHSAFTPKTPASSSKRQSRLADNIRATSITGIAFQDDTTLISCGECDGSIKVWDLRKNYSIYKKDPLPKHSIPYCGSSTKNGYSNLIIDDARVRLYASCMDNVIYCFNISTYGLLPEQRYVGHENGTFYIKTSLSPDCKYLVSGSSDKNAYIWNVKCSEPIVKLTGHSAEVTCAAWCQKGDTRIVTCSDDARHKIWKVGKEFIEKYDDEDLCGRAEVVPKSDKTALSLWSSLEKTPKSLKKRSVANTTPGSSASSYSAKRLCRRNSTSPNVSSQSRRTKRCLTDMMNAARLDNEEAESSCKRLKSDLATIAETNENVNPQTPKKTKRSSDNVESFGSQPKCKTPKITDDYIGLQVFQGTSKTVIDWAYTSPKKVGGSDSFITPTKYYEMKKSPKILSPKPSTHNMLAFSSPTMNLPNYVLDGEAPHLRLMSPVKKKQETTNWLTMIVKEKRGKPTECLFKENVVTSPSAVVSPKAAGLSSRRISTNSDKTPKKKQQRSTLLKYFNVSTTVKET